MIDRIVALYGKRLRRGTVHAFSRIMVFDIPARLRVRVNGAPIIPTPSSELPEEVLRYGILSDMTLAALDAGEAIFQIGTVKSHGQTEAAIEAHIITKVYPRKRAEALADYTLRWRRFGKRVL